MTYWNYLRGLLRGSALSMISGFELSNENYDAAFTLLKGHFNKNQLQIAVHMKNLLKILTVSDLKNISLLRYIYDNTETQIRSLDNVTPETYGIWLIPLLQSNFPSELNLIITRYFNDLGCWVFTKVLKVFEKELSTREKTFSPVTDNTKYIVSSLLTTINSKRILTFSCLLCTKNIQPKLAW